MRKNVYKLQALEFEGIVFQVSKRPVKYARIEYNPAGMVLIVPRHVSPLDVLKGNKKSILRKYARLKEKIERANKLALVKRSEEDFNAFVQHHLGAYARQLKVKYSALKWRKMRRRWGSCRSNGVITLNTYLFFLPEKLVAYIIYHELAHLKVRKHDKKFKTLIAREFPDWRALDKELNLYGLRLLH